MKTQKNFKSQETVAMEFEDGSKLYVRKWYQYTSNPNRVFYVVKPKVSTVDDFRLPQQIYTREFLCTKVSHGLIMLREEIQKNNPSTFFHSLGKNFIEVPEKTIKNIPENF